MTDAARPRSDANRCFVCGPDNAQGLRVPFRMDGDRCRGRFTPAAHHNSFDGVTHGGIVFSLLDDAMGNWLFLQGERGVTAKCEIRYRQSLPIGTEVEAECGLRQRKGRLVMLEARLTRVDDGSLVAEAEASFMVEAVPSTAAAVLLEARRARRRIARLPESCRPADAAAGYAAQAQLAAALGEIGGWKIGAGGPDETPLFAPIIGREIHPSGAVLALADLPDTVIEAEIAFRVLRDLPPRAVAHDLEEVAAAVEMLPALEIYFSRFIDPAAVSEGENLADCLANAGLIVGASASSATSGERSWDIDLAVDDRSHSVRAVRHPVGDPLRLVVWLANRLNATGDRLRAGQVVTTGALALGPIGREVRGVWQGLGSVTARFG